MPRFVDLATVSGQDMRSFDTEAKKLVGMFHDAGWRSYMSNNSHAILQAPDGETTASVSGHNDRAQVKRGRAELDRWLRRNGKRRHKPLRRTLPARSFENDHEPEHENRSQESNMTTMPTTIHKCLDCPDGGREFKNGQALAMHRQRTHDGLACPECGDKFWSPAKYNAHRLEKHGIERAKKVAVREVDGVYPCPHCTAKFGTKVGLGSHMKVHKDETPPANSNGASHATAPPAVVVRPSSTMPTLRPAPRKAKARPEPEPAVEAPSSTEPEPAEGSAALDRLLGEADPAEVLTNVLAILAPSLLGQIERLRRERDEARDKVEELARKVEEFEARMSIMRDAMTL